MTVEALLSRLVTVKARGKCRWTARCPAHDDRSPSLSIAEGKHAILVHCFGGCSLEQICRSLGLSVADLFDSRTKVAARPKQRHSVTQRLGWQEVAYRLQSHAFALWIRAESVLGAAHALDSFNWSDDELNIAIDAVAKAYGDIERADLLEDVAVTLRARHLHKESISHAV